MRLTKVTGKKRGYWLAKFDAVTRTIAYRNGRHSEYFKISIPPHTFGMGYEAERISPDLNFRYETTLYFHEPGNPERHSPFLPNCHQEGSICSGELKYFAGATPPTEQLFLEFIQDIWNSPFNERWCEAQFHYAKKWFSNPPIRFLDVNNGAYYWLRQIQEWSKENPRFWEGILLPLHGFSDYDFLEYYDPNNKEG